MNTFSETIFLACAIGGITLSIAIIAILLFVYGVFRLLHSPAQPLADELSRSGSATPSPCLESPPSGIETIQSITWSRLSGIIMLLVAISFFVISCYLLLASPDTGLQIFRMLYALALLSFLVGSYFTIGMPLRLLLDKTLHIHLIKRHQHAINQPESDLDRIQEREIEFSEAASRALMFWWKKFFSIFRQLIS